MALPPPAPDDARESLYAQARLFREKYEETRAVLARIRQYAEVWTTDKRMKVMGRILLREIDRFEKEEADRTRREGR